MCGRTGRDLEVCVEVCPQPPKRVVIAQRGNVRSPQNDMSPHSNFIVPPGNLVYTYPADQCPFVRLHTAVKQRGSWRLNVGHLPIQRDSLVEDIQGRRLTLHIWSYIPIMDFPPMDWGALFTLDHATFEPPLADPPGTPVIGEANSLAAFPKTQHKDGMQPSEANTIARLGVCSSCRKYGRVPIHRTEFYC